ncbi:hypothetical protein [Parafrankia sp. EUN1f]|uniref:hypothetical protein n=1 Tax=Parafrankia sp. EUN1f TaxID=102897 RepID=UPI0001C459E6|nr:hypothetical protein [Parafrankia sp. EUN1f]EFC84375.1 hypothetical protein FrEUN1fDRAFT_2556 [Parafrankia sp. EUN1f]
MTVHTSPAQQRPILVWALTAVVVVGVVLALVGMILNAWVLLGLAAGVAALAALALLPAGVMSHVTTTQSATDTQSANDRRPR